MLRKGYAADITTFDADRIIDKSTYTNPFQYSTGVEYVIVNGKIVPAVGYLRIRNQSNPNVGYFGRPTQLLVASSK